MRGRILSKFIVGRQAKYVGKLADIELTKYQDEPP
jgi:sporulation protein YlmC with PRC-barrel domain